MGPGRRQIGNSLQKIGFALGVVAVDQIDPGVKFGLQMGVVAKKIQLQPLDYHVTTSSVRRKFLDGAICQLRPRYAQALAEYNRLYDHKTRILRDWPENPSLLQTLDDFNLRMAQTGAIVIHYRAHFIKRLPRPRNRWASMLKSRFRLNTSPLMKAEFTSSIIISLSYLARWDRAADR